MQSCRSWILLSALIGAFTLTLASCTTMPSEPKQILRGVFIRNMTDSPLQGMELNVVETGSILSCSHIVPRGFFLFNFEEREARARTAVLSWRQEGRRFEQVLKPEQPTVAEAGIPRTVVVEISEGGRVRMGMR